MKSSEHKPHVHKEDYSKEYMKFGVLMLAILLVSYYLASAFGTGRFEDFLRFFMGVFFVVFASFKFWSLEKFPAIFAGYDIIAKRHISYAYAFPFIQLLLGVLYLTNGGGVLRDLATLAVTGVGAHSVITEVYLKNRKLHCACLGDVIKLPLSTITLIEDAGMALMAIAMILL